MSESETIHKKQIPQLNDKSKDRKKESNFAVKRINNDDYNSKRTDAYGTLISTHHKSSTIFLNHEKSIVA